MTERFSVDLDQLRVRATAFDRIDGDDAATMAQLRDLPEATAAELPPVLIAPPWRPRRRRLRVVVDRSPCFHPASVRWRPGERAEWAATPLRYDRLWLDNLRARAPSILESDGGDASDRFHLPLVLALAPPELARSALQEFEQRRYCSSPEPYRRLLGCFEDDAVDFVVAAASYFPNSLAGVLEPVGGTAVSIFMARWLYSENRRRTIALRWFDRHFDSAATDLIAIALGRTGRDHVRAESTLRILAEAGYRDGLAAAAVAYHPQAPAAVTAILDADPVLLMPQRVPKPRRWIAADRLPRLLLRNRQAVLPLSSVRDLITMLMMCGPGGDHAGVRLVTELVDPVSAATFGRALLDDWAEAGYPAGNDWVLNAQAVLGCELDSPTAQRFVALSRQWSQYRKARKAREALEVAGTAAPTVRPLRP